LKINRLADFCLYFYAKHKAFICPKIKITLLRLFPKQPSIMKKILIPLLLLGSFLPDCPTLAATPSTEPSHWEAAPSISLAAPARRRRQRKGFLWRLFKKKRNRGCDCPRH
jgi:hypothetical protein